MCKYEDKHTTFPIPDGKSSTIVNVNIYLRSINDIDDYKMEFSVQITFRQQWNDVRLEYDDLQGEESEARGDSDPRLPDTIRRGPKEAGLNINSLQKCIGRRQ